jgi:hypothetical protein
MQYEFAASGGLRPAGIAFEIGGGERQAIAWLGATLAQHCAHVAFALQVAHGRAHLMARGEKLQDAMAADKARPAGDQNHAHRNVLLAIVPSQ